MLLDRFTARSSKQTSGYEIDTGRDWYALYTCHQHEKNLARSLGGKSFEVFLPLYTAVHSLERSGTRNCLPATVSLLSLLAESIGALALDPRNLSSTSPHHS